MNELRARCCIAGGGPAGMMLGYLLARAGVDTVVLEKHADFLRDFRGDTVHPSTLEVMHELGLLEEFLQRPHQKVYELGGQIGGETVMIADFRHLPVRCGFIAFMPQWDFLDFLAQQARKLPAFRLKMQAEAAQLIEEAGRIAGVRGHAPDGEFEVRAELTVAADGRHSVLRDAAGLQVEDFGAPMDVLWMKLTKRADDPAAVLGRIDAGRVFVTLDRGDYWQCAYVIPKGGYDEVRAAGLGALREGIGAVAPELRERTGELRSWDDVKLLAVQVDRLHRWHRPGLLCIGDAAHAMSPIGGVGINLAIQDAVAAANLLAGALLRGTPSESELAAVQRRRDFPTRMTQRMQLFLQTNVLGRVLASGGTPGIAWPIRLMQRFPMLRRIPARLIGMGFRPEHTRL
ncbi:MAG TPA: FAD-dependent oxidoreductase [Burkholderiales bacterium]|nr:FAD-dependent oxidoreductase [Burkholderiales bacterium]